MNLARKHNFKNKLFRILEGHKCDDAQKEIALPKMRGHIRGEPHSVPAPQEIDGGGGQRLDEAHIDVAPSLLNIYVQTYEQAQKLRLETMNRMRCWLRDTVPKEEWPCKNPDRSFNDKMVRETDLLPNDLREFLKYIEQLEKDAKKYMRREMKKHPLWPWLEGVRGIDTTLAARLLHRVGDLRRFPNVAKLWSYAGLDGPGWRGRPHNWGLTSVCYNIAESFQKQPRLSGVYRDIYDARKEFENTKPPCEKCIEQGFEENCRPAHINNRARRYAVKEFLKDLWVEGNMEYDSRRGKCKN